MIAQVNLQAILNVIPPVVMQVGVRTTIAIVFRLDLDGTPAVSLEASLGGRFECAIGTRLEETAVE